MNVQGAWSRGYTGKGVVVTILDDGIELTHPDLRMNYVSSSLFIQFCHVITTLWSLQPLQTTISLRQFSKEQNEMKSFQSKHSIFCMHDGNLVLLKICTKSY